jgi:CheY-like chemotaxis protein
MTSPLHVLVVEDDVDLMAYFCALVASWGFTCDQASSATSALRAAETRCPDVVLSDLVMPGMDGLELLKALRSVKARCKVCQRPQCTMFFVLITGYGSVSEAVRAIMEGADEVLVKPIKEVQLFGLLQRVDAQRRQATT